MFKDKFGLTVFAFFCIGLILQANVGTAWAVNPCSQLDPNLSACTQVSGDRLITELNIATATQTAVSKITFEYSRDQQSFTLSSGIQTLNLSSQHRGVARITKSDGTETKINFPKKTPQTVGRTTFDRALIKLDNATTPSPNRFYYLNLLNGLFIWQAENSSSRWNVFSFLDYTRIELAELNSTNFAGYATLLKNIAYLKLTPAKDDFYPDRISIHSNILSTKDLRVEYDVPASLKTSAVSSSVLEARASMAPQAFTQGGTSLLALQPDCCCKTGNTFFTYLPGTFQGDPSYLHSSYEELLGHLVRENPCLSRGNYQPWSAWASLAKSTKEIAADLVDNTQAGDCIYIFGYSGGACVGLLAGEQVDPSRHVHVIQFGAPNGGNGGYSAISYGLNILPPFGGIEVGVALELESIVPVGAIELARGACDQEKLNKNIESLQSFYSENEEANEGAPVFVSPESALAGPHGERTSYENVGPVRHDKILETAAKNHRIKVGNCCGNGENEVGEACDSPGGLCNDKNNNPGICTKNCACPVECGNGKVSLHPLIGEDCDPPGRRCGINRYTGASLFCSPQCKCPIPAGPTPTPAATPTPNNTCNGEPISYRPECSPPGSFCVPTFPGSSGSGTCNSECRCIDNCVDRTCQGQESGLNQVTGSLRE